MLNTAKSDRKIYLDYSATTPIDPEVLEKMMPYLKSKYGNPSSIHSYGRDAKRVVYQCKEEISKVIGSLPEEIIFTGSGTESDNLAIIGVARANRDKGNHIIISAIEHKAIIESVKVLQKEGFEVGILSVDKDGLIDIDECFRLIKKETILISIIYANNEIGTIQPIRELSDKLKRYRDAENFPLLHTDACQAPGLLTINVGEIGVDLMTLNGSKIYGPKGIGILFKRENIKISPIIVGGEQEMGLRAGTENISLMVGFTEALKKIEKDKVKESNRLLELRDFFISELYKTIPDIILNGHKEKRLQNNINISIPDIEGESILLFLDKMGIYVSTGSACSSFDLKPSHVLMAIGQNSELLHGSIRFSLGKYTSKDDIQYVMSVLPDVVKKLKGISALTLKK